VAAGGKLLASPLAKTLAVELGIDLRTITGTGPGGRIVERDVRDAARWRRPAPAPAPAPTAIAVAARPRPRSSRIRSATPRWRHRPRRWRLDRRPASNMRKRIARA
jgi:pyruvate/2-oxoglutarate dehydrogenase complex dihydrolipoamide acyltransferase (E2) component